MVSLFERLEKGRPPQIEEPVKQSRRHADQKALIKDVLANGPAPPLRQLAEQFAAQVVCAVVERDKRNAFEQHCPDTLFGFLHAFRGGDHWTVPAGRDDPAITFARTCYSSP